MKHVGRNKKGVGQDHTKGVGKWSIPAVEMWSVRCGMPASRRGQRDDNVPKITLLAVLFSFSFQMLVCGWCWFFVLVASFLARLWDGERSQDW